MKDILFLCIGNSKISGDSLGPIIGSFLQKYKYNMKKYDNDIEIDILGTIQEPIGYKKIDLAIENIKLRRQFSNIIIIDSALGDEKNIGKILINTSNLYAGEGVNKGKKLNGDIIIKGIVGKNHHNKEKNIIELKNIENNVVEKMAFNIISMLYPLICI